MQIDAHQLARQYATLSEEAFLEINRHELVESAQAIYDAERAKRGIPAATSTDPGPDWLDDASIACRFPARPGEYNAPEAEQVREVLEAAGIQAHLSSGDEEILVMIPSRHTLLAESVIDREIYNPQIAADWKTHLETLSDNEFRELDFETLIGGLKDRIERLRQAYEDEKAARD